MESEIRDKVKERYGGIAAKVSRDSKKASCCSGSSCGCDASPASLGYTQNDLKELPKEAVAASLGCANPLLFAQLKEGETVLDLGSGGGIDVLAASRYVGDSGLVYGLDMTDEMLALANENKVRMGAGNVEFLKGYIEDIPLKDASVDVVMSNCVINLSEDKAKALSEAYRVLKPGGRLAVADMVTLKSAPPELRKHVELWCGCLAGTLEIGEYERILKEVGFREVSIEPVIVYTKEVIEEVYGDNLNELDGVDVSQIYGAFASAHIKAVK